MRGDTGEPELVPAPQKLLEEDAIRKCSVLLAFSLKLKHAEGIRNAGYLHLPFSLPGTLSRLPHSQLLLAYLVSAKTSPLKGPSLTTLAQAVTHPYCDPLCFHHYLLYSQHSPLSKHFWVYSCLFTCCLPPPLDHKAAAPTLFPPSHLLAPQLTPRGPHVFVKRRERHRDFTFTEEEVPSI